MNYYRADANAKQQFDQNGYVLVRELFSKDEMQKLIRYAKEDPLLATKATSRSDAQGGTTTLALENTLSDNLYSRIVRSERITSNMELFLEDEVYHYHHKMMLKEPFVGGAWEWHQDYGYWYNFGCLLPTMASCFIAVDRANQANGCLQVLAGSQKMGRVDHGKVGGQTGADPERVEAALQRFEHRYVEMEPGDAIFFHGNLLHRSDQNRSENPRWALICCYNTKGNNPYKESRHPMYTPLSKLADSEIFA
ncbi:MAG: phytanoyl-CoA dioxygenase family protein [Pirellulales bacterium]